VRERGDACTAMSWAEVRSAEGGCESEHERERERESESESKLLVDSSLLWGLGAVLGLDPSKAMRSKVLLWVCIIAA
jgi:hypothetical protein